MPGVSQMELVPWIMGWVRTHSLEPESVSQLTDETDVLAAGMLDSLAFIQLLAALEQELGTPVDLSEADPSEFTTVRGLSGLVARQLA